MLEPSSPAGEPFETQEQGENAAPLDFEQVCVSLVERGWKILPKKGSYPINKQGPRYVNLVDPRGNRKSIRVVDPALWEKLRTVETTRSRKKGASKAKNRDAAKVSNEEFENDSKKDSESAPSVHPAASLDSISEFSAHHVVARSQELDRAPQVVSDMASSLGREVEKNSPGEIERPASESSPQEMDNKSPSAPKAESKAPPQFQNSILQLGLDSLMHSLQSETLSPADVLRKIQDWMLTSKNLTEYMDKLKEQQKIEAPKQTSEKDQLISELQAMLKETEDRLSVLIHSAREI